MSLRISRRIRQLIGCLLFLVLVGHFWTFFHANYKLKNLDVFHSDSLGREEHWKAPEKQVQRYSASNKYSNRQRQAKEFETGAKHQMGKVEADTKKAGVTDPGLGKLQSAFQQTHYVSLYNTSRDNLLVWKNPDDQGDNSSFARLWEHFNYYHSPDKEENIPFNVSHFLRIDDSICRVALAFNEHLKQGNSASFLRQVVLLRLQEDLGGFSAAMDNETGLPEGRELTRHWNDEGCREAMVFSYLSHPNTRAVFTTQYQVYDYAKIHSLPLGIRSHEYGRKILHRIKLLRGHMIRTQLLMINDLSKSSHEVASKFRERGYNVQNTHGTNIQNYLDKMTTSKFILSPGFDSHQHWEALFTGCIPIMQHLNREDGWYRTFVDLPIAWIDSFENLTPQWLEKEYHKLITRNTYKWEKLTQQYWVNFIKSFVPDQRKIAASDVRKTPTIVGNNLKPSDPVEGRTEKAHEPVVATKETDKNKRELEELFYEKHYYSLRNTTIDNMMVWETQTTVNGTTFSRFWEHFDYFQPAPGLETFPFNISHFIRVDYNICQVALAFNEDLKQSYTRLPHVVLFRLDEEVGGFSSPIDKQTGLTVGRDMLDAWSNHGCSEARVFQYLSHPRMRAIFTTQYHIYDDRKLHSIPLGIKSDDHGLEILKRLKEHGNTKSRPRLVMAHADPQNEAISKTLLAFQRLGYTVENSYSKNKDAYFDELQNSKFILSTRGTAFDSHQHWEALFSGCIPVIEHFNRTMRNGWMRTFDDLPVAWIDSYDHLTPQWLEQEYDKIIQKAGMYTWDKLTKHWWIAFVKSFIVNSLH